MQVIEYRPSDINRPPYRLHVHTESPFLGKRLEIRNTLTITPKSDNTTVQRLHGTVKVRMLGMGRIIEHIIRDSVTKTYKQLPAIIARWEAFRVEAVERGDPCALLRGRPPVGGDLDYVKKIMCPPYAVPRPKKQTDGDDIPGSTRNIVSTNKTSTTMDVDGDVYYDAQETFLDEEEENRNLERILAEDEQSVLANIPAWRSTTTTSGGSEGEGEEGGQGRDEHLVPRPPVEVIVLEDYKEYNEHVQFVGGSPRRLVHPAVARHRRGLSIDSVDSSSEGSEVLSHRENRTPGSRGAKKAWKRFNRDYEAWDKFWGKEIGVKAISAAHQGAVRVVHVIDAAIRAGALKIVPGAKKSKHRRSKSAPEDWPSPDRKVGVGRTTSPLKPSPRKATAPSRFAVEEGRVMSQGDESVDTIPNTSMRGLPPLAMDRSIRNNDRNSDNHIIPINNNTNSNSNSTQIQHCPIQSQECSSVFLFLHAGAFLTLLKWSQRQRNESIILKILTTDVNSNVYVCRVITLHLLLITLQSLQIQNDDGTQYSINT